MSVEVMAFAVGVFFVGVAILGGGVEIRELKIPAVNSAGRAMFFVAGLACIVLSLYLSVYLNAVKTTAAASNPAQTAPAPLAAVATAPAPNAPAKARKADADGGPSAWLNVRELQEQLNTKIKDGFYPGNITGKCDGEAEKFQVEWKEHPLGLAFVARSALTKEKYDEESQKHTADGFTLDFLHSFKDCSGRERLQAQWVKQK